MESEDALQSLPDDTAPPLECTPDDPTDGGQSPPAAQVHPTLTPPPHGRAAVRAFYGDIHIVELGPKKWAIQPVDWEGGNLVLVRDFPWIGRKLYVHKDIVEPTRALLAVCEKYGYAIDQIGAFNVRPKRVNGDPSVHCWAAALDINSARNPQVAPGAPMVTDMPMAMVEEIEALGWTWGGRFGHPDPMHFQWCSGY